MTRWRPPPILIDLDPPAAPDPGLVLVREAGTLVLLVMALSGWALLGHALMGG